MRFWQQSLTVREPLPAYRNAAREATAPAHSAVASGWRSELLHGAAVRGSASGTGGPVPTGALLPNRQA